MDIRTYRAASLQEALCFVRQELGPDAAVLQTRQVSTGFMGMFGRRMIEVQASVEVPVARRFTKTTQLDLVQPANSSEDISAPDMLESEHVGPTESHGPTSDTSHQLPTAAMLESLTEMLDADIDPELARELLRQISDEHDQQLLCDPWLVKSRLCQLVSARLRVSGPIDSPSGKKQIVALVGPTGVGKTTTLAKLAAGFHFDQGCQVGLISLDIFRIGAVDQLRQFAELIPAPIEVVSSPEELPDAIKRLNHCQLILLDTAGRSPNDTQQISVLGQFLRAAQPTAVHLVLSATSSSAHVQASLERFAKLEPTHLLLTKLDEAICLGSWLPVLSQTLLPLSYLTTGQQVPDDILVANRRRMASLILGYR